MEYCGGVSESKFLSVCDFLWQLSTTRRVVLLWYMATVCQWEMGKATCADNELAM